MKILITGASGFTGKWLLHYLQRNAPQGTEITGLVNSNTNHSIESANISIIKCNLLKRDWLKSCISPLRPDMIIHLAGLNHGTLSNLLETNVVGTKNLLDTVLMNNSECRILIISSGAVYGNAGSLPISEKMPCKPLTDYGISKTAQEIVCSVYQKIQGAHIAVVRPFNLVGPGQSSSFVCGRIISQVHQIHTGERETIDLADTSSSRDFIDVRDAVAGYWSILSHPNFEKKCAGKSFNIGSGKAYRISQVIDYVEEIMGETFSLKLPGSPSHIQVPFQRADISRIHKITGWSAKIPLKDSLRDMLFPS